MAVMAAIELPANPCETWKRRSSSDIALPAYIGTVRHAAISCRLTHKLEPQEFFGHCPCQPISEQFPRLPRKVTARRAVLQFGMLRLHRH